MYCRLVRDRLYCSFGVVLYYLSAILHRTLNVSIHYVLHLLEKEEGISLSVCVCVWFEDLLLEIPWVLNLVTIVFNILNIVYSICVCSRLEFSVKHQQFTFLFSSLSNSGLSSIFRGLILKGTEYLHFPMTSEELLGSWNQSESGLR